MSRQGLPVRTTHNTASTKRRLFSPLRPGSPGLPRQCASICAHWASVSTSRSIVSLNHTLTRANNPDSQQALVVFRRNTIELLDSRKRLSSQAEILAGSLAKERALATEQRNFICTISHEFRTPLMAIDGHAQRLIATKERAKPAEIADRAEKIRAGVFRMTSLVGSLVNAMELARGDLRARMRSFDLKDMLENLVRYYAEIGVGGGLEARFGQIPMVIGDRELLYQV